MAICGVLAVCGGSGVAASADDYIERWAEAWSSGDVYDTVAFYEADVQVSLAQPDLELTFSAGTWDSTTSGEGRSWLANWLDRQTSQRERRVEAAFIGPSDASVLVIIDDLDTAAWFAWDMGASGIAGQSTLRWRDAHKPRGVPDPRLGPVDDLLSAYIEAWGTGNRERLTSIYAPDAVLRVAGSEPIRGIDAIAGSAEDHRLPEARIAQLTVGDRVGPAVFVGRIDSGEPVSVVIEAVDPAGCAERWGVTLTIRSGSIESELRQPTSNTVRRCLPGSQPTGWWEDIQPPPPLEEWETAVLANEDGGPVSIINGTPELELFLEWALERFTMAGLDQPLLESVTFGPVPACADRAGVVLDDGIGSPELVQCTDAYAVCRPGPADCEEFALTARFSMLHELAHVWMIQRLNAPTQTSFSELFGLAAWDDRDAPWHLRGVEYGAEVLTWGLLDEAVALERIGDPPCPLVAEAWTLLTATAPPRQCA
jgi:ketosteroid isomerase-like protein